MAKNLEQRTPRHGLVLETKQAEMNQQPKPKGKEAFTIKTIVLGIISFRGVVPFLSASVVAIALIMLFPQIALYIPTNMR